MAEQKLALQVLDYDLGSVDLFGQPVSLPMAPGQSATFTTLSAVTGNATGVTMDCGSSCEMVRIVSVGTGTLTGTLTIEGSLDDATFVSTGSTVSQTAAGNVSVGSGGKAFRYYRVSLSGAAGAGTVTCKIMSNG